jgi:hypothetical protein
LFEERLLLSDDETLRKARAQITNPRLRIAAEITWLTGLEAAKINKYLVILRKPNLQIADDVELAPLVRANLLAAAFQWASLATISNFLTISPNEVAGAILKLSHLMDSIDVESVMRVINEDRVMAGFSEIRNKGQIESELVNLRRSNRDLVKDALNRMPPESLVAAMTEAVALDTGHGENHASTLLDELVDVYQIETVRFLAGESEKITSLLNNILQLSVDDPKSVSREISKLEAVARTWTKVAKPTQVNLKARGIDDNMSQSIGYAIRSCAIDLFNKHNMLDETKQISELLRELFVYVPDVNARLEEDAVQLDNLTKQSEAAAAKAELEKRVFANLKPIKSAPSLSTINGFGFTVYGNSDYDPETGSKIVTYYFVMLGIPIFPIRRYRVIKTKEGYRFLGKTSLRTSDLWHLAISISAIAALILYLNRP